jgi:hypothetical protein
MKRPSDDQPTAFSDSAAEGVPAEPPALAAPSEVAAKAGDLRLPPDVARRTGVLFVHGIGTQGPAETFLDWSTPMVELLTDWRAAQAADAATPAARQESDPILDPVWRAEFSFNAASPPYLELSIPPHADLPATTWVVTEAWWAADLRHPSLGRTIDYLRRRMRTLVSGIASGYRESAPLLRDLAVATDVIGGDRPPLDWRIIESLDGLQARTFGARPVGALVGLVGVAILAGYDVLRRIPIGPIRDFAIRRMIDSFLVDWFGDLPVLLDDHVQAANVRARVARSIERLRRDGCDAVVVVAHSGGALVTFETLLDPAYAHLRVDKLITLGQGLGLAWRLAADPDVREIRAGHRLVGNLAQARPDLRWVDIWSSYDPAPAGPLPARGGLVTHDQEARGTAVVATVDAAQEPWLVRADVGAPVPESTEPRIVVESRPVTNEMNVLTDHGAYWANPEGFLIPVVRHIDASLGDASASRFYRDRTDRARRIVWRRQRVGALAAWGWLCSLAAAATIGTLILLQATGEDRLTRGGNGLATAWSVVPGHELVSTPIIAAATIVGAMAASVGLDPIAAGLASLGRPLLAMALVILLFYVLVKAGVGRWHDWDLRERRAMHPESPILPDRSRAAAQALLLVGGLAGLVAACLDAGAAAAILIVLGAASGLFVWAVRPFRPDADDLGPVAGTRRTDGPSGPPNS